MSRRRRLCLGFLITICVFSASSTVTGQGADSGAAQDSKGSARATMRTFLVAMSEATEDPSAFDTAVDCLDLSNLDATIRKAQGRELAIDLKEVLDRTRLVRYEEIPDDASGPPYIFLRDSIGEVVIAPGESREWRFTSSTVSSIPDLLRAALQRERVEGVAANPRSTSPARWIRSLVPDNLKSVSFLLEHWQWLALLTLALVGVLIERVVAFVALSIARRTFVRLLPAGRVEVVQMIAKPLGLLVMSIVWWFGVLWLGLPPTALSILLIAIKFFLAASSVWLAYRFVDVVGEYFVERAKSTENRFDDLLVPLVRKSLKVFIVAFGLVFVADNLNVDITSLVAGLGIGGLAFALAAQDTVKNLFGSLTVILDRPFRVGDWVVVGTQEGTVEEVGFRSTRIRTFYNSVITLPNANLIATPVDNLGARSFRRWKTLLSVTYDTPPHQIDAFCEGIRELVRRHPHTRKDYFHVYANEFSSASLDILVYVFFSTADWGKELAARHDLFLDILRLAERLGVEFAFPTQTLHVLRPGEMPDHGPALPEEEAREAARVAAREIGPS